MKEIIPVVVINDANDTIKILSALREGGINCAEITFRTACAREAIEIGVKAFPDMNDVQLATAKKIGIPPLQNRAEAENSCGEHLVYVGISPYYLVKRLNNSISYLVPRAQLLLNHIGRTFIDSLMVKKIRPSKIIVTSLTRTEEDVRRLQRYNPNATDKSCHFRGTTFDISYSKYAAINDPDSAAFPQVRDDSLKWVLSEVLRDQRNLGLCYVKYEKKQGCFHITVR